MKGRHVFMNSLVEHDVSAIFGNPGTTENPLLDSLIDYPDIRYYVALHESVAVCAASFYSQATGTTSVVNLHVAPGLGNGIGMMFGALKANSPMIVTAGQQDTRMRLREPLLSHDLVAMAEPVVKWSAEPRTADEMAAVMHRAFKIANEAPAGPVFVSLPVNVMSQDTDVVMTRSETMYTGPLAPPAALDQLAALLAGATAPVLLVGDDLPRDGGVGDLVTLAQTLGAGVWHEGLRAQMSFPNRHPNYLGRIPFEADTIRRALAANDVIVLIGGPFFEELWYDAGSPFPDGAAVVQLESTTERLGRNYAPKLGIAGDLRHTLTELTQRLASRSTLDANAVAVRNEALARATGKAASAARERLRPHWDADPMLPGRALFEVAAALPEGAVVVDESITASLEVGAQFDYREVGDYFAGPGRRYRPGCRGGHRHTDRLPRPTGDRDLRRWFGYVQYSGALDGCPSRVACRVRDSVQSRIPGAETQSGHLPATLRRRVEPAVPAHGPDAPDTRFCRTGRWHGRAGRSDHGSRSYSGRSRGRVCIWSATHDRHRRQRQTLIIARWAHDRNP